MRSSRFLAFSIRSCNALRRREGSTAAIPAGDDGRPALPADTGRYQRSASVTVAWREQLKARVRFESLKAHASEQGQKVSESTDQLIQQTKDELDSTESKVAKADQVAAGEFDGFKSAMARDLEAIEAHLKALDDSIAGDKTAAASLEVEEDHD
jgi:hypothetical protein